jgi:hypothetical protein
MKKLLFLLAPCLAMAQTPAHYWQQEVHYTIDIDFDVKKHQFDGEQKLVYINNSPDTIHKVYYHLYFNAFQPGSMMDERAKNIADVDKRIGSRIRELRAKEVGYHKVKSLKQGETDLQFSIHETLLKARLNEPLAPGDSTTFNMVFNSQVPVQIRRSGRNNAEGVDYTMTQWYPKLAEYDEDGWHPEPYIAREFYGVFGTFDVNISIDHRYKLGGTGLLLNEAGKWGETGEKNGIKTYQLIPNKTGKHRWQFHAENVHDFAWAADPEFIRTSTEGPNGMELNFFYLPGDWQENWEKLPKFTVRFFELMNQGFGTYAYPQFSVIQGGDGGMEYPMCTMLKGTGKLNGLIGVMVHESAHNWYYGMLASNEFRYPWMDEGFTSFAEEEILNVMLSKNEENPHKGPYRAHSFLIQQPDMEPLSTPGDYYDKNRNYGISAYSRGQVFLAQLRYIVGEEAFNKSMLTYFDIWKFKHPKPWDFIRVVEKESDIELDWYLNFWMNTSKPIDYAIGELEREKPGTNIQLKRIGGMPMPVEVHIELKNGQKRTYYIPLTSMFGHKTEEGLLLANKPWSWTSTDYALYVDLREKDIEKITIDKGEWTADINRENNVWPRVEKEK